MPILKKKEKERIEEKWARGEELTQEEASDINETYDFENGFDQPRWREVVDEDGYVTWETIDN